MAAIQFRTKIKDVYQPEGDAIAYQLVMVPEFKRAHCDMAAFRKHPKFGGLANSDLFPNVLRRVRSNVAPHGFIRLDRVPEGVTVDTSGFLALVTVEA